MLEFCPGRDVWEVVVCLDGGILGVRRFGQADGVRLLEFCSEAVFFGLNFVGLVVK